MIERNAHDHAVVPFARRYPAGAEIDGGAPRDIFLVESQERLRRAAHVEVLDEEVRPHRRRIQSAVVLDPGNDVVRVAHPRDVEPRRISLIPDVAVLDLRSASLSIWAGGPGSNRRIPPAIHPI